MEHFIDEIDFPDKHKLKPVTSQDAKTYPFNCIGLLIGKTQQGKDVIGTGFLIASDLVLTAAHNILPKVKVG